MRFGEIFSQRNLDPLFLEDGEGWPVAARRKCVVDCAMSPMARSASRVGRPAGQVEADQAIHAAGRKKSQRED